MAQPTRRNLLQRLWSYFTTGTLQSADNSNLQGSQYPIGNRRNRRMTLPIPEMPVRAIYGDMSISHELIEMKTWSYEARHAIGVQARDCFQQLDGRSASWGISETTDKGQRKVHPDVIAIGTEIATRTNGRTMVLGGDRLQRAARDMQWAGDAFLELAIEREGIGSRDWCISRSLYLPALSTFVDEDDTGEVQAYVQQAKPKRSPDDIEIHPVKMLQFSYEKDRQYGNPLIFQSLEPWRKIKAAGADLEDAAREAAIAPWLHIMPSDKDEKYREAYQQRHESMLNDGIITNLYLLNSAEVRKATSGSDVLKPLIDYFLMQRYMMIPPGMPHYLFPGLGLESHSAKDISGQPALNYARTIANLRSQLGTQIKWAVSIEIVLKKGWDWFLEYGRFFDIVWGAWSVNIGDTPDQSAVTPVEQALLNASLLMNDPDANDLPAIAASLQGIDKLMASDITNGDFRRLWDAGQSLRAVRDTSFSSLPMPTYSQSSSSLQS